MLKISAVRTVIAAGALAIAIGALTVTAEAGQRQRRGHSGGDLLAAGVLGAVVGSLIAPPVYAAPVYAAPVYVAPPPPVYYEPPVVYSAPVYGGPVYDAPVYGGSVYDAPVYGAPYGKGPHYRKRSPKVVTYEETVGRRGYAEPWSKAWFDWCRANYRSFDGRTGTFKDYDGQRYFCQVK